MTKKPFFSRSNKEAYRVPNSKLRIKVHISLIVSIINKTSSNIKFLKNNV